MLSYFILLFQFTNTDFASADATKGLSDRPLETFGYRLLLLSKKNI